MAAIIWTLGLLATAFTTSADVKPQRIVFLGDSI